MTSLFYLHALQVYFSADLSISCKMIKKENLKYLIEHFCTIYVNINKNKELFTLNEAVFSLQELAAK